MGSVGLSHSPVVSPSLSACECGAAPSASCHLTQSTSQHLAPSSPPWLPISAPPTSVDECFFLTPWLSDFHTARFSSSSVLFGFFFNWLLSFFWLCEKAKCIYLCLHFGWKWYQYIFFNVISLEDQNFWYLTHFCILSS